MNGKLYGGDEHPFVELGTITNLVISPNAEVAKKKFKELVDSVQRFNHILGALTYQTSVAVALTKDGQRMMKLFRKKYLGRQRYTRHYKRVGQSRH